MKGITLFFLICFFLGSCKSLNNSGDCSTKLLFSETYTILLPCNKQKDVETEYHGEKHYIFNYKDGSKFFINDDINVAPILIYKYLSNKEQSSFVFYDKLLYEGKDENSQVYWKVIKQNGLVLGYVNVPESRKFEFDQALLTLRQKGGEDNSMLRHELLHHGNQN